MKRLIKKGFSMVELLFVMVVLAALAAIAIPNMSSGANSAALVSVQSDSKNLMSLILSEYSKTGDLSQVIPTQTEACESKLLEGTTCFKDLNADGISETKLLTGAKVALSKDNEAVAELRNCEDTGGSGMGFFVSIVNVKSGEVVEDNGQNLFKQDGYEYNSCTDSTLKQVGMSVTVQ